MKLTQSHVRQFANAAAKALKKTVLHGFTRKEYLADVRKNKRNGAEACYYSPDCWHSTIKLGRHYFFCVGFNADNELVGYVTNDEGGYTETPSFSNKDGAVKAALWAKHFVQTGGFETHRQGY